jgi:hypothetical protein
MPEVYFLSFPLIFYSRLPEINKKREFDHAGFGVLGIFGSEARFK